MTFRRALRWIIPTLWLAFVIFLSCQTGSSSGKLSEWLTKFLFSSAAPIVAHALLRVIAHFGVHFVLGFLVYQAARYEVPQPASFTLFCGFTVAVCDELIQLFISGRAFEICDIAFNVAGIIVAIFVCVFITPKQKTAQA